MENKRILLSAIVVILSVSIFFGTNRIDCRSPWAENIEALSEIEDYTTCFNGYHLTQSCYYNGLWFSCSISCAESYYACCTNTGCYCN